MTTWAEFAQASPELSAFGQERFSSRVAYLATIRPDGSPRVHPVTPIIGGGHLFVYMEPMSPKGRDLQRDPRFALHAAVEDWDGGGGEFLMFGRASQILDAQTRAEFDGFAHYKPKERYILFEFFIEEVKATTYENDTPIYRRWPQKPVE